MVFATGTGEAENMIVTVASFKGGVRQDDICASGCLSIVGSVVLMMAIRSRARPAGPKRGKLMFESERAPYRLVSENQTIL